MKQVLDHGERGVTLKPNKLFVAIWTNFFEFTSTTPHCIVARKSELYKFSVKCH